MEMHTVKARLELAGIKVIIVDHQTHRHGFGITPTEHGELHIYIDDYKASAKIMNDLGYTVPSFIDEEQYYRSLNRKATSKEQRILRWGAIILVLVIIIALIVTFI